MSEEKEFQITVAELIAEADKIMPTGNGMVTLPWWMYGALLTMAKKSNP